MQKAHLHLIKWAVERGYSVAVYGHGDFDGIWIDYGDIVNEIELNDCGYLELLKPNGNGEYCYNVNSKGCYEALAAFHFENGPSCKPDERISGNGNATRIANQWRQDYEAACQDEENRFNTTQEISSKSWRLQDADGNPVVVGQNVMSFRGAEFKLVGGIPPHKPTSSGKVYGVWIESGNDETYYPTVFNLKWVDLNLEVGEDLIGEEAYL